VSQRVVSKSVGALLSCNTSQNRFGYQPTSIFVTYRANTERRVYEIQKVLMTIDALDAARSEGAIKTLQSLIRATFYL
jgi:hypothetical protein